jgi:hypothetical protein
MKKLTLSVLMALGMAASSANATGIYIDVQHDYDGVLADGDANTTTDVFTQMAAQFNSVSDVSNPSGNSSKGGFLNFAAAGDQFTDKGWGIINGFLGPQVSTANELVPLVSNPQLTFWFDNIQGHYVDNGIGGIAPVYTAGDIHFMFDSSVLNGAAFTKANYDPGNYTAANEAKFKDGLEILTLSNVHGGPDLNDALTLVLNSEVSFAKKGWWFTEFGEDFDKLISKAIKIAFRTDFNDDQSVSNIGVGCTVDTNGDGKKDSNCTNVLRESNHNGSTNFEVPEPSIVALLGIGLLGMGLRQQRKA